MTKTNLGRICFVPRGTYSASESYKRLDVVSSPDNGISYVAIADSTGAALTDETKWQVMVDNSAAIRQLKGDVAAITPDDTAVDGKPWTSKKTVDSLCMPLEATGNPVQVCPVEGYPLGVKVSWEPVQEGSGDPSPDNIRPITGRDAVRVTRCGKNLIDPRFINYLSNNIYIHRKYDSHEPFILQGGVTYTLSIDCEYLPNEILFRRYIGENLKSVLNTDQITYTPEQDTECYFAFYWSEASGVPEKAKIQLELGSTATPYEPYTGAKTDIALPETVYGGTLDVETGVVTVNREAIKYIPTERIPYGGNGYARYKMILSKTAVETDSESLCDRFRRKFEYQLSEEYEYVSSNIANIWSNRWETLLDAVTWFKENPTTIVYKLSEPYTIQLSPQQIAALSGVNTLYTDTGTLTVTGREDPRHTIVTLTDRIAALESAAAGV